MPRPATRGSGSSAPTSTRATPDARTTSVQGGVSPVWSHGSSETARVPPAARSPASSRAMTSAWGDPGPAWAPRPTIRPSASRTMAPTRGWGWGRAGAAREIASRMSRSSSMPASASTGARPRRSGASPPSPIRTVTVGPGISPGRPPVRGFAGSTAGRDLHPALKKGLTRSFYRGAPGRRSAGAPVHPVAGSGLVLGVLLHLRRHRRGLPLARKGAAQIGGHAQ